MRVAGDGDSAVITLSPAAVVGNMQDDAGAFEAWSLALRHWCGAEVALDWDEPRTPDDRAAARREQGHYQRFLYRVQRFRDLFDWFSVVAPDPFRSSRMPAGREMYLNAAGDLGKDGNGPRRPAHPEAALEAALLSSAEFDRHFGFGPDAIKDRQLPVGLYSDPVASLASAVFPGGKGAIDLVCLDHGRLWLFELKARSNISVGTLTEILFYASVMRDAVRGRFRLAATAGTRAVLRPEAVASARSITGVILGHALHPLLADPGCLRLLNAATASRWNGVSGAPAIDFRAGRIVRDDPLQIIDL